MLKIASDKGRLATGNYVGPKVRARLCQIIRQHQLDPNLVKSYAVDFCGTKTLREASWEQVENFVAHLSDCAEKDRNALGRQFPDVRILYLVTGPVPPIPSHRGLTWRIVVTILGILGLGAGARY